MRRISALTALVFLLTCWALPADAAPRRLRLTKVTVASVVVPVEPGRPVVCDGGNFFNCGYVGVEATFSGLQGRSRPAPGEDPRLFAAGGTVTIWRSYSCVSPDGQRVRGSEVTVRQNVTLNTRRGQPVLFPEEGDTLTVRVWAFLFDAQPGNCPAGTDAVMTRLATGRIRLSLESRSESVPSAGYRAPSRSWWRGSVPTPATAG